MIEYFPGTFGDFICSSICYSINDFFDPMSGEYTDQDRWWVANNHATMKRNKYPLSCRGGGYEHVEKYTELMLEHMIFLDYPKFNDIVKDTKIMFNTHMKLNNSDSILIEDSRTLTNSFSSTDIKFLTLETSFDNILMCTCNEYYTSLGDSMSKTNWETFFKMFAFLVKCSKWRDANVEIEKRLTINNILDVKPEDISYYGMVNEEKFFKYYNEFKNVKLDLLHVISNKRKREIFANPKLKQMFTMIYEKDHDYS